MRTAPMAMKPLVNAPPSSPEFIIKKPHDEARRRPKQWRPLEDATQWATRMSTVSHSTAKRVTRTYSKRESAGSNPAVSDRPVKRQRTEPSDTLPPLPPVLSDSLKAAKKAPSTIDGYFFSAASLSGSRSSGPSSDGVWSGNGEVSSPPSSPPARRWTSPRKLRFGPSLLPIEGAESENHAATGSKRKWDRTGGEGDGSAIPLKTARRRQLSGGASGVTFRDEKHEATGNVSEGVRDGPEAVRTRSRWSITNGEGEEKPGPTLDLGSKAGLYSRSQSDANSAKGDTTISQDPTPDDHDTGSVPETTTIESHSELKPDVIPDYTMPYKFYLANPKPQTRPAPPTTTAKKPIRTIQTTLNLSTKQPFKECKLCDTVFNPLLAGDVKVHQLRHARVVGEGDGKRGKGRGGRRRV